VAAFYWKRPTAKELQGTGLKAKHFHEPDVTIDEESWAAFDLYRKNQTQWICGPGGPIGLNYAVLHHDLDFMRLEKDDYDAMMEKIRIIESEALK